jgi:hypothetical protein
MIQAQTLDGATDAAQQNLRRLTDDWAELQRSFKESDSLDTVIAEFERSLVSHGRSITTLPDDNPAKKELLATLAKVKLDFATQAPVAMGALEAKHLKANWESYSTDAVGWERETPATFDMLLHRQSQEMSRLGMSQTVEMHSQAIRFLKDTQPKTKATAVTALMTSVTATRDSARSKLTRAAEAILAEAAKTTLTQEGRDRLESFGKDDLRLALEGSPDLAKLQARAAALVAAFDDKTSGTQAATAKLASELTQQATTAWPQLVATLGSLRSDFDPLAVLKDPGSLRGQPLLLSGVANRMGWDFKPGAHHFALHRNGVAVVGSYDPVIKAMIDETLQRLDLNDLPETEYDLVAEVIGTAKATVFQNAEGEITLAGSQDKMKVTGRREVSEEAIHLHIIGLHVGPVAAIAGVGAAQADGTLKKLSAPVGAIAGSGGGWMGRLLSCALLLGLGLITLAHTQHRAVATLGPVQLVYRSLGSGGLSLMGLVGIGIGLLTLPGMLLHGLLVPLAYVLVGMRLALNTLSPWLPSRLGDLLRTHGSGLGLGACAIALGHLVCRGALRVL